MVNRLAQVATASLLAAAPLAHAHDSWFHPLPSPAGEVRVEIGTGSRFPIYEVGIGAEYLTRSGCRAGATRPVALRKLRNTDKTLVLRSQLAAPAKKGAATSPVSCWVQLTPFEIELAPDKIDLYWKEINPSPEQLATWKSWQERGLPWRERYTKSMRVELATRANSSLAPQPVDMGLDVLLANAGRPIRPGDELEFQVLRDGAPFGGFNVELRGDQSPIGIWRKTDAEGRVRISAPLPGHWILRGVDLRVSETTPDTWESRFITLAFEVVKPAAARTAAAAR